MFVAPRIVFFGMPRTGKTGLLHAFADPEAPFPLSSTQSPVPIRKLASGTLLYDVNGTSAKEIIVDPRQIDRKEPTADQIRNANAIVLAIDATATTETQLDLFRSFAAFLSGLEESRCKNREVGGLPVFLTLTKCDALYRPGDDPSTWLQRVEDRKHALQTAFEDYLASTGSPTHPFAFGSIDVHLAATALQFPPASEFESLDSPFGIEELKDECESAARAHANRAISSHRRLRWTLAGAGTTIGGMIVALGILLSAGPTSEVEQLIQRIHYYHDHEGSPAVRLSDRVRRNNLKELLIMRQDRAFAFLPTERQDYLNSRIREINDYQSYRELFHPPQISPSEVRTLQDISQLETDLKTRLQPPPDYLKTWSETEAVSLAKKWQEDLELIRAAERSLNDWYRGLIRQGTALLIASTIDNRWNETVNQLLKESEQIPFDPDQTLKGSATLRIPRGQAILNTMLFEFDRIDQARSDWTDTRERVLSLRNLGAQIGFIDMEGFQLSIPAPTDDRSVSSRLASELLAQWKPTKFLISDYPDPIRSKVQLRLNQLQLAAVQHVHEILRSRRKDDTLESWRQSAEWFKDEDAKAWGELLGRLDPAGTRHQNPIEQAITFLKKESYEADFSILELRLPNDLRDRRLIPRGDLRIRIDGMQWNARELIFRQSGEPEVSSQWSLYRYIPMGHDGKIDFHPGDIVTADLTVRSGTVEYRLLWNAETSSVFSFDRLNREPELRALDSNILGERATGVRLLGTVQPELPLVLKFK